jgi:hypothetical protein
MNEPKFTVQTGMTTFLTGEELSSWLVAFRMGTVEAWIGERNRLASMPSIASAGSDVAALAKMETVTK